MADVYVRIAVPNNQTNASSGDYDSIGHYDLIIDQEIDFGGHFGIPTGDSSVSMVRPVFSWGTDNNLTIKPLADANIKSGCTYYKWHFSVSQTDIENLLNSFDSVCNTTTSASNQLIQFRPTGSFNAYSIYDKNCFVAVSVWMNALGIVNLSDIVSGSLSRRMYTRVLYTQVGKFVGWPIVSL